MDGAAQDGAHLFSLGFQLQLWIDSACQLLKARGRQVVTPITHPSRRRHWLDDGEAAAHAGAESHGVIQGLEPHKLMTFW